MDLGERFEKIQLEQLSTEDPDSVAYYNARKNIDKKRVNLVNFKVQIKQRKLYK